MNRKLGLVGDFPTGFVHGTVSGGFSPVMRFIATKKVLPRVYTLLRGKVRKRRQCDACGHRELWCILSAWQTDVFRASSASRVQS